tara:strand:- start:1018 stop:1269 length:252 start_codon:yes stop_codon:yes gene_type:complete
MEFLLTLILILTTVLVTFIASTIGAVVFCVIHIVVCEYSNYTPSDDTKAVVVLFGGLVGLLFGVIINIEYVYEVFLELHLQFI